MIRNQVLKHLSVTREGKRGGSKGDVSGGATAEERWEKVGMSELLMGSEEMIQLNTSSPRGSEIPFETQRG